MKLTLNLPNAGVNLVLKKGQEALVLAEYAKAWGKEKAKQDALSKCYTVNEAATRLKCSWETILKAMHTGKLRFATVGDSRGYVITEQSCREFTGDIQPED